MPFVDLNNPNQNDSGSDAQNNSEPVVRTSTPELKSVAKDSPPVADTSKVLAENKENMNDEHTLMRDVPNLANGNAHVNESGVREIKGPPIGEAADTRPAQPVTQPASTPPTQPVVAATNNNSTPVTQPIAKQPVTNTTPIITKSTIAPVKPVPTVANTTQTEVNDINKPIVPAPVNNGLPPLPKLDNSVNSSESPIPTGGSVPAAQPAANQADTNFNLQGSVKGQEKVVEEIFKKADETIKEQQKPAPGLPSVKLETADEKFINSNATLNDLLTLTEKRNASDLHLSVDYPPILRVDGKLLSLGGTPMTEDKIKILFDQILTESQKEKLNKDLDLDFSHTHTTGSRFRINIFHKKGTLAGAFRLIPSRIRSIAELNLPSILYDLVTIPQGLIILAGPTGSGKSTTIASMVQEVNLAQPKHIVTIEDPIEYIFPKGTALINQREIGTDATSFERALREVLRQDPDVILVGEMRDYEAISMTITSAETGHLVFSTLHTNSASQTVDRMIDVFPDAQQAQVRAQLANVIAAVISQRLVPIKGGGRKAVLEVMIATPAIRNAIREGKTYQIDNMIQTNAEIGMITLEKSLIAMIKAGEISLEDAQTYTSKPEELISLMKSE